MTTIFICLLMIFSGLVSVILGLSVGRLTFYGSCIRTAIITVILFLICIVLVIVTCFSSFMLTRSSFFRHVSFTLLFVTVFIQSLFAVI